MEHPFSLDGVGHIRITDGDGHYLELPSLTTTQRDALSAVNGMQIYNSTTAQMEAYEDGSWGALGGATGTLLADGTVPLTADWDAGGYGIRALSLTADGLTSGRVVFAGTNGLLSDDAGLTFGSNLLTVTKTAIGVTQGDYGLALVNTTAAAAGAQQWSPPIRWHGEGRETDVGSSMAVDFRTFVRPIQGAAAPTGALDFQASINGGAYATKMSLLSAGNLSIPGAYLAKETTSPFYASNCFDAQVTNGNVAAWLATTGAGNYGAGYYARTDDNQVNFSAYDDSYTSVAAYAGKAGIQADGGNFFIAAYTADTDIDFYAGQRTALSMSLNGTSGDLVMESADGGYYDVTDHDWHTGSSSRDIKTNIVPWELDATTALRQLQLRRFQYLDRELPVNSGDAREDILVGEERLATPPADKPYTVGYIVDEVPASFPHEVITEGGNLGMRGGFSFLAKAMQEIDVRVYVLEKQEDK